MQTLAQLIARSGKLSAEQSVRWALALAKSLTSLHQRGGAHGAISADTIECEGPKPESGKLAEPKGRTTLPVYHSPERSAGGSISPADDTWAVAVTMYFGLTGRFPYLGDTDPDVRIAISTSAPPPLVEFDIRDPALQVVVSASLHPQRASRTLMLVSLAEALEGWLKKRGLPPQDGLSGTEEAMSAESTPIVSVPGDIFVSEASSTLSMVEMTEAATRRMEWSEPSISERATREADIVELLAEAQALTLKEGADGTDPPSSDPGANPISSLLAAVELASPPKAANRPVPPPSTPPANKLLPPPSTPPANKPLPPPSTPPRALPPISAPPKPLPPPSSPPKRATATGATMPSFGTGRPLPPPSAPPKPLTESQAPVPTQSYRPPSLVVGPRGRKVGMSTLPPAGPRQPSAPSSPPKKVTSVLPPPVESADPGEDVLGSQLAEILSRVAPADANTPLPPDEDDELLQAAEQFLSSSSAAKQRTEAFDAGPRELDPGPPNATSDVVKPDVAEPEAADPAAALPASSGATVEGVSSKAPLPTPPSPIGASKAASSVRPASTISASVAPKLARVPKPTSKPTSFGLDWKNSMLIVLIVALSLVAAGAYMLSRDNQRVAPDVVPAPSGSALPLGRDADAPTPQPSDPTGARAPATSQQPIATAAASEQKTSSAAPIHEAHDPVEVSACARTLFADGTFSTTPSMSFICEEVDPRRGAGRVRSVVVRAGRGRSVSDGMREWAAMGWYELAAFGVVRAHCCASISPLELPPSPGACPSMADALNKIGDAVHTRASASDVDQAIEGYRKAVKCLHRADGTKLFGGYPGLQGGEETSFRRTLDRREESR